MQVAVMGRPHGLLQRSVGATSPGSTLIRDQIKKAIDCDALEAVDHLIERAVKDVHDLDFSAEIFDKIFHNETMCHWMDKQAALSGLFRALKKGGLMGFHDWARGEKGDLNDAGGDFPGTYAAGEWFQNSIRKRPETY